MKKTIKIIALFFMLPFAYSGVIYPSFPDCAPRTSDFKQNQLHTKWTGEEGWHRSPGAGGQNYGKDYRIPDEYVLVGAEVHEISEYNTKGNPDIRISTTVYKNFSLPVIVHVGQRLTPQGMFGAGASYKFKIKFIYVTKKDWLQKAFEKALND